MIKYFFVTFTVLCFLFSCSTGQKKNSLNINKVLIKSGAISGKISNDQSIKIFMGIPFAEPPVGDLRWKAPQPVQHWNGIRACVNPPASAMQNKPQPFFCWSKEFLIPEEPISEDCLYINIWTPAKTAEDKFPVMVWIHGGGLSAGSGTVPLYDGEALARKGIVFVTVNYRLGIFGFLAHPELSAESENHVSGNYGILDQIAALQWVQDNIASFGGDSEQVTIAGQSAGAFSVNALMVSPLAKGLFSRAIAQSGGMFGKDLSLGKTLPDAETNGQMLTERLGVSVDVLRSLPADSLLKLSGFYGLTIDNVVIPPIRDTFAAGMQNDVPLLSGWNADDGVSFGPATPEEKLSAALAFGWNNYIWAKLQTKTGKNPAYLYYFKRVPPGEPNFGAFHSAEFAYALHTLNKWDRPFIDADYSLEEIMSSYWVNFAKNGNPNGEGLPVWNSFNEKYPEVIELGEEVKTVPLPYQKQLYFLDETNRITL